MQDPDTAHAIDVAIVGGGPAGLQAALVLARAQKRTVVFDSPEPPRNAASRGVHNFVGLDGLTPAEIRTRAWQQIDRYGFAQHIAESVTIIERPNREANFTLRTANSTWEASHVVLACGYRDVFPKIDGFAECWASSIIPCPFCDGYENRGRIWGVVIPAEAHALDVFPSLVQNWTDRWLAILPPDLELSETQAADLAARNVPVHHGTITSLSHDDGLLNGVTLDSGEHLDVETLLWTPPDQPLPLIEALADKLGLGMDDNGYVIADEMQRTNIDRLWAAGDVQGWTGAIESADAGSMAASMIAAEWYADPTTPTNRSKKVPT